MLGPMSDPWSDPPGGGQQPPPPPGGGGPPPPPPPGGSGPPPPPPPGGSGPPPPPPPPPPPGWSTPPPTTPSYSAPPPPPFGGAPAATPGTGYGPTPAYTGPTSGSGQKTNVLAIVALVCGILSLVSCGFCSPLVPIGGLVTGVIGRNQIRDSNGLEAGDGMAMAGLITSGLGLVLSLGLTAFWLIGLSSASGV